MKIKITEIKKGELEELGIIDRAANQQPLPSTGDKLYFKTVGQYTVIERHFNFHEQALYDVELFVKRTRS